MRNPQELLDLQRAPKAQPTVLVGAMGGVVALLRAETGALLWRRKAAQPWLALAHGGDIVYISSWSGQPLRPPALLRRGAADYSHRRQRVVEFEPARVEARRASDGALLWEKSDWGLVALAQIAPQGDKVLVASRHVAGDHTLHALDAQTGAVAWTRNYASHEVDSPEQPGTTQRFVAASAGRVYLMAYNRMQGSPQTQRLYVLEAASGRELWSCELQNAEVVFSPDGQLLAEVARAQGGRSILAVLSASDGAPVGTIALTQESRVCGLSDSGIAYVATSAGVSWRLSAMRGATGAELWRAADATPNAVLCAPDVIVSSYRVQRDAAGSDVSKEVRAFDAQTGAALWQWRTPTNPRELLRLWRARVPEVVAGGARQAGAYIAYNFASARQERNPWRIVSMIHREITVGLWRRPHVVELARLTGGRGAVYLGTRLGLFALDAKQGRLLWYALPNTDLSDFDPAISPNAGS
ncbi:MAG TPA: PQQ-binding-like beta-propeller repeat protein [Ktedonobacterales bacterium]|jgi:outer membrane protein assembly factor BamB